MFHPITRLLTAGLLLMLGTNELPADDWSHFRGPNGSGVSSQLDLNDELSMDQLLWQAEIGAGTSSPVFAGDRLFVSSWEGTKRSLHCLKSADGKELWTKSVEKVRQEAFTSPNCPATCTPVCNGQYVAVFYPDAGLCVYTLDGSEVWKNDLGPFFSMHGISASPILEDNYLVVTVDQLQAAYIVAFDVASGKELWRVERLLGITGGYSTPGIMAIGGVKLIVSAAPGEMLAYDLKTGEKRMSLLGLTNAPVSLPVIIKQRIFYTEPPGKPLPMSALGNADKNGDQVIELTEVKDSIGTYRLIERLDQGFGNGDGKVDEAEWNKGFGTFVSKGGLSCIELSSNSGQIDAQVLWKYTKTTPYIPSVLVKDDLLYIINDGGVMICIDALSGAMLSRQRLNGATGQYYASPVMAGNRIVIANLDGKLSMLSAGRNFQLLSTLDLAEPIVASPAVHQGRLYIRSSDRVYCFGKKS